MIALVKDTLIYATVLVAIIYIPSKLGGWDAIFSSASEELPKRDEPGALIPSAADAQVAYATLALGSAMALFLYPHALTAVLSSRSQDVVRRNVSLLSAWTFLLGLMALLGYMPIAAGLNAASPTTPFRPCSSTCSRPGFSALRSRRSRSARSCRRR
jgi:SSS family solute:Na+ symporter